MFKWWFHNTVYSRVRSHLGHSMLPEELKLSICPFMGIFIVYQRVLLILDELYLGIHFMRQSCKAIRIIIGDNSQCDKHDCPFHLSDLYDLFFISCLVIIHHRFPYLIDMPLISTMQNYSLFTQSGHKMLLFLYKNIIMNYDSVRDLGSHLVTNAMLWDLYELICMNSSTTKV